MHIRVRAFPEARKEAVKRLGPDRYEVHVKEDAQRGAANERIKVLLGFLLNVPPKKIRFVSGRRSSAKIFHIS